MKEIGDATTVEDAPDEFRVIGHLGKLAIREGGEFLFRFRLVSLQFLMLEVIPDFLIGIPIRGVGRQVEDVEPSLTLNEGHRFL